MNEQHTPNIFQRIIHTRFVQELRNLPCLFADCGYKSCLELGFHLVEKRDLTRTKSCPSLGNPIDFSLHLLGDDLDLVLRSKEDVRILESAIESVLDVEERHGSFTDPGRGQQDEYDRIWFVRS